MKSLLVLLITTVTLSGFAADSKDKLKIGDKATHTDLEMKDVSGKMVSIDDVKKDNGVLVLFSSNTCPFVMRWEERYLDAKKWADKNNVGMIVLNSNYHNRDGVDSFEAMKEKADDKGYNFYYVVDKDSRIANAYGGQTTPHAFLFNGDGELVYKGAIDDNYKSADQVSQAYLKDAIKSLGNGEKVAVTETEPIGCSIKRKIE
ncbi:MAG: thioredoxin family protein [bacterium]